VSGKPVDANFTLAFEGKTVGFCCDKCPVEFQKEPAKFAANIKADAPGAATDTPAKKAKPADKPADKAAANSTEKPTALKIVNTKCPLSGDDVDKEFFSIFENKKVGFCCDECKGKFDKEPKKYAEKIVADVK
jgi:YHS domain-containing protein